MTATLDQPRFLRMYFRPCPAPPVFPLPDHRTMAQVIADEAEKRCDQPQPEPVFVLYDYGSPYAVRRAGE